MRKSFNKKTNFKKIMIITILEKNKRNVQKNMPF